MQETPRFLITRLSALGDCLVTLPVACALRDHFPHARIVWLCQHENAPLLRAHDDIDEVITVSRRWFRNPKETFNLINRLRRERFTTVFDPQSLTKSSVAGLLTGCCKRFGLGAPWGRELAPWLNTKNITVDRDSHVVDRFLALLRPLGIYRPAVNFRIPMTREALAAAKTFVESQELTRGYAVINPGAGWASRRWSTARYAEVARELDHDWGVRSVVVWHGNDELQWAHDIVARSGTSAIMAPPTTLFELAALMQSAAMFVGSDCGPMHLAAAMGTPSISLHGTTRPEHSGPYGESHIRLQMRYHGGSSRVRRKANNDAMLEIQVAHVVEAASTILSRRLHSNAAIVQQRPIVESPGDPFCNAPMELQH
ncbi:MAG: glycosyltransferase family 9 protein [Planctomycetota bacterium]|nr:glycosyltransferase family 9 protein [Planctomycetota bacterium]MDA1212131.1 glycosyltransferase family 9 protein [Planctomycetota bacterium]